MPLSEEVKCPENQGEIVIFETLYNSLNQAGFSAQPHL